MTELHEAASMGDSDLLEELIDSQKFDVNQKDVEWNNRTPLHWASIKGHSESIRVLIEHGSKVGARTDTGWTAAHFAAEGGKLSGLKVLHKLNAPMDRQDKYGDTPKKIAGLYGHKECVKFLETAEVEYQEKKQKAINAGKVINDEDSDWERELNGEVDDDENRPPSHKESRKKDGHRKRSNGQRAESGNDLKPPQKHARPSSAKNDSLLKPERPGSGKSSKSVKSDASGVSSKEGNSDKTGSKKSTPRNVTISDNVESIGSSNKGGKGDGDDGKCKKKKKEGKKGGECVKEEPQLKKSDEQCKEKKKQKDNPKEKDTGKGKESEPKEDKNGQKSKKEKVLKKEVEQNGKSKCNGDLDLKPGKGTISHRHTGPSVIKKSTNKKRS
ncbi:uncharacterized protein LOC144446017 [Glandiceps talaboti]